MGEAGLSPSSAGRPLSVWAVSDGRVGMANQVLGLAEAVAQRRPCTVTSKQVVWRAPWGRAPQALNLFPLWALSPESDPIEAPWPDLWIAAGRATLPLSMGVRRWSAGKTFVVQLQDPRWPTHLFDLVIPPEHDELTGPNVFPIVGSPNRITPERLAEAESEFHDRIAPLPSPRVAVLVGGKSKAHDLTPQRARDLASEIATAVEGARGSVLVTFSRRTPEDAQRFMAGRLGRLPGWVWDGEGPNPYHAFLAAADLVLVTEDSTNMAAEAAAAGKPVLVMHLDGDSPKHRRLHDSLRKRLAARPFRGALERWSYPPLRETERAAGEVVRRMGPAR
ncbi:MAG: mitochondrial fission ELM1 family protein [Proteobacteria bacterium]|nr:mitochondrial fission ELM1 family protein [Pseudomonadota bacterium]